MLLAVCLREVYYPKMSSILNMEVAWFIPSSECGIWSASLLLFSGFFSGKPTRQPTSQSPKQTPKIKKKTKQNKTKPKTNQPTNQKTEKGGKELLCWILDKSTCCVEKVYDFLGDDCRF